MSMNEFPRSAFRVLLLLSLALPFSIAQANDRDGKARIITQVAKPAECLSRVAIQKIDGKEKFVSPQAFELSPGRHSLSGSVAVDTTFCKVVRGRQDVRVAPLEADFEAGKTYWIGYDHSSKNREDWKLVIWKVE